jgi:transposase
MTINVGVDLHKTQFTTYYHGDKPIWGKYVTTAEGYDQFTKEYGFFLASGAKVRLGVESTGNTRYFKNAMERAGFEVKVINTLKFKVVNESVKKTDKHDAMTIAEFLEKDMLPESKLCSEASEQLRRLLTVRKTLVRTMVSVKNQIHGLLVGIGMEDEKGSLQSKRGRRRILEALSKTVSGLVVQPLFTTIEALEVQVKSIEDELEKLTEGDEDVELLKTIPGCGKITSWTIRAYTDDIGRYATDRKYAAYAGLAPWVQCSNETAHYGRITKRGPEGLRTALVQLTLGMVRAKKQTLSYRIMKRYEQLKKEKGSGKSIIATSRKLSSVIWHMLTNREPFDPVRMLDKGLARKSAMMRSGLNVTA